MTPAGNIKANPRDFLTNLDGIYAAGDATSGPRSVIQAVVGARRSAENIHAQIMGIEKEAGEGRFNFSRGKSFKDVVPETFTGISSAQREKMPERQPEKALSWILTRSSSVLTRKRPGRRLNAVFPAAVLPLTVAT